MIATLRNRERRTEERTERVWRGNREEVTLIEREKTEIEKEKAEKEEQMVYEKGKGKEKGKSGRTILDISSIV